MTQVYEHPQAVLHMQPLGKEQQYPVAVEGWIRKMSTHQPSRKEVPPPPAPMPAAVEAPTPVAEEKRKHKHRSLFRALFKHEPRRESSSRSSVPASPSAPAAPPAKAVSQIKKPLQVAVVTPMTVDKYIKLQQSLGSMMVGGKRVPFTRDEHKRKREKFRIMPALTEGRPVGQIRSAAKSASAQAYRNQAYYPAQKQKKDKP